MTSEPPPPPRVRNRAPGKEPQERSLNRGRLRRLGLSAGKIEVSLP